MPKKNMKGILQLSMVAQACNPSYLRGLNFDARSGNIFIKPPFQSMAECGVVPVRLATQGRTT
jgi:hypothetical protein